MLRGKEQTIVIVGVRAEDMQNLKGWRANGEEYCKKGSGVLTHEEIAEYLCPDAALQGRLGVAVDTTVANVPFTASSFAVLAEPLTTSSNYNATPAATKAPNDKHDGKRS